MYSVICFTTIKKAIIAAMFTITTITIIAIATALIEFKLVTIAIIITKAIYLVAGEVTWYLIK